MNNIQLGPFTRARIIYTTHTPDSVLGKPTKFIFLLNAKKFERKFLGS